VTGLANARAATAEAANARAATAEAGTARAATAEAGTARAATAPPGVAGGDRPGDAAIGAASTLVFRPLSVVRQRDDYLVGDVERGDYIAVPEIGVMVIELLRSGHTVGQAAERASAAAGTDVDVADFAQALCAQGFAGPAPAGPVPPGPASAGVGSAGPAPAGVGSAAVGSAEVWSAGVGSATPGGQQVTRSRWANVLFGPFGWSLFGLLAAASVAIYLARPRLFPHAADPFFLNSPVRSVVAATIVMLLLGFGHEICHLLAARAEGVPARITVSRRLYLLVLETDLTRLWSIPRRRRYAPLMVGIALDLFVLVAAQVALLGRSCGWWLLPGGVSRALAALSYLQVAVIVPQFFVFLRTDIYAVLATATGCLNLWQVTRLTVRARLRLATAAQREELTRATPHDLAVARWFGWVYAAGMVLATWFFVSYFLPVTVRLLTSMAHALAGADIRHTAFWEALGFGLLLLSSRAMTLWVFIRDLARRRRAGAARPHRRAAVSR
jgi:putative peptide zinc metalloprotease protein